MAGHGGAWKVAFADFMTAMMALFLVLWISAQDKEILIATSKYFQNPFQSPMEDHSGIMPFNKATDSSSSSSKNDEPSAVKSKNADKQIELSFLNSVAADFYRLLHLDQTLDQKPIDIQVTSDGLRITLYDRSKQPLFKDATTEFTDWGVHLLQSMAWLIDRHHFRVTIDGHTREGLVMPREDYSLWELSADRANAARRKLVHYAVDPAMIERVTGFAATRPLQDEDPAAESNQRITLSLAVVRSNADKTKTAAAAKSKPAAPASPRALSRPEAAPREDLNPAATFQMPSPSAPAGTGATH
jgi:chemotaxis protein MotB